MWHPSPSARNSCPFLSVGVDVGHALKLLHSVLMTEFSSWCQSPSWRTCENCTRTFSSVTKDFHTCVHKVPSFCSGPSTGPAFSRGWPGALARPFPARLLCDGHNHDLGTASALCPTHPGKKSFPQNRHLHLWELTTLTLISQQLSLHSQHLKESTNEVLTKLPWGCD